MISSKYLLLALSSLLARSSLIHASPSLNRGGGPHIDVTLAAPAARVSSIETLEVVASITNRGTEDATIFRYNTVLDNLPTQSFTVKKDGVEVPFTGFRMQMKLTEHSYVVIPAGKTINIAHKVSDLYDFASAGTGVYTFEPSIAFQSIKAGERLPVSGGSITVEVTDDVKRHDVSRTSKRSINVCQDDDLRAFLDTSSEEASLLAAVAGAWLDDFQKDVLFMAYFGNADYDLVRDRFEALATDNSTLWRQDCSDPFDACIDDEQGTVISYYDTRDGTAYYCPPFFQWRPIEELCFAGATPDGPIRAGGTLHETTHALLDTRDYLFGCEAIQQELVDDDDKLENAENYNCFAQETYIRSCEFYGRKD